MIAGRTLGVVGALLVPGSVAHGATYFVPNHYTTIQAALTAAAGGDTIIVRDGTYTGADNRDLDFGGKALTLTAAGIGGRSGGGTPRSATSA